MQSIGIHVQSLFYRLFDSSRKSDDFSYEMLVCRKSEQSILIYDCTQISLERHLVSLIDVHASCRGTNLEARWTYTLSLKVQWTCLRDDLLSKFAQNFVMRQILEASDVHSKTNVMLAPWGRHKANAKYPWPHGL